MQLFTSVRI